MCKVEDRCTYSHDDNPLELRGFWALAATNKLIRNEARLCFLRDSVISIHPQCLKKWLKLIEPTGHLNNVRRVTLAGPNTEGTFCEADIQKLCTRLPNLESIGVQCQGENDQWKVGNYPFAATEFAPEKR